MKSDFLTPVMRMVQGDPFEAQTKDMQGAQLTVKTGPNAGQPTQRFFVAGAIRKDDPAWPAFWALLNAAARDGFPTLFDAQGNCLSRDFSWKVADGDSTQISKPGETPNAQKEGFAGHWIVKFSSSFKPKVFYAGKYAPHEQIQDPNVLRRGYYIRIAGTVEGNGNAQKPGVYVNLNMVEFAGMGKEIISGPDANAVFGGNAAALPVGATPLPMHSGMPAPGAAPLAMPTFVPPAGMPPMPGAAPVAMPSPPVPSVMSAPMAVAPYPAVLAGPGISPPPQQFAVPGVPMAAPAPIMPVVRQMTAAAQGYTYEQLVAHGHTDVSMRAQGLML